MENFEVFLGSSALSGVYQRHFALAFEEQIFTKMLDNLGKAIYTSGNASGDN